MEALDRRVEAVVEQLGVPTSDSGQRVQAAALCRSLDELFADLYGRCLPPEQADAFVHASGLPQLLSAAARLPLPWQHRLGIVDNAAGILDNYFSRCREPDDALACVFMVLLPEVLACEVSNGYRFRLSSALESVLLLLARLLPEDRLAVEQTALAKVVAGVLAAQPELEGFAYQAAVFLLRKLLRLPEACDVFRACPEAKAARARLRVMACDPGIPFAVGLCALNLIARLERSAALPGILAFEEQRKALLWPEDEPCRALPEAPEEERPQAAAPAPARSWRWWPFGSGSVTYPPPCQARA